MYAFNPADGPRAEPLEYMGGQALDLMDRLTISNCEWERDRSMKVSHGDDSSSHIAREQEGIPLRDENTDRMLLL